MQRTIDTRSRILRTIIDAQKPLSLSAIAKRTKMPAQKVDYHLDFLCGSGLIIKDGYEYFCQPVLIDPDLKAFCAEKMAEVIDAFSAQDSQIVVANGQDPEDVILNTLHVLIQIVMP
jgi:hypothetical protein